jgi:hypothetical protein
MSRLGANIHIKVTTQASTVFKTTLISAEDFFEVWQRKEDSFAGGEDQLPCTIYRAACQPHFVQLSM